MLPLFLFYFFTSFLLLNVDERITRFERESNNSKVMVMSSQFYTYLSDRTRSPEISASRWQSSMSIHTQLFNKKMILIPINIAIHWSLAVILNPGKVLSSNQVDSCFDKEEPAILFFDSYGCHNHDVIHENLCFWLNFQYRRVLKDQGQLGQNLEIPIPNIFNKDSLRLLIPKGRHEVAYNF